MNDKHTDHQTSIAQSSNATLWFLLVLNVLAGIATIPAISIAIGVGSVTMVSNYRVFELNDLIEVDRDSLQKYEDGRFAGSWTQIPDFLAEHAFKPILPLAYGITAVFGMNALLMTVLVRKKVRVEGPRKSDG